MFIYFQNNSAKQLPFPFEIVFATNILCHFCIFYFILLPSRFKLAAHHELLSYIQCTFIKQNLISKYVTNTWYNKIVIYALYLNNDRVHLWLKQYRVVLIFQNILLPKPNKLNYREMNTHKHKTDAISRITVVTMLFMLFKFGL